MPSADMFCTIAAFGSDPLELRVQVQNNVTDPDGLRLDAAIDGTAGAMALPSSFARQKVEMRVYVNGTLVPNLNKCRVTRQRDANLQTWEFSVPIERGTTGYAGDWTGRGVGLCKSRVDIVGVYKTTTGTHEVDLISNGIADNEGRATSDGHFVTYTGVDAGGRYDGETIDFILPPGSGLTRDRVVKVAATRAGVESISLETSGVQMMKELQLADTQFLGPCQEIADVEGRMIQWDRQGYMHWPQYGSDDLVPASSQWTLNEKFWVLGSTKLEQPGELLTEVTVEGDEQVLVGACGDVSSTVTITTSSLNGPIAPAYEQSPSSSYAANPAITPPTTPITTRVEILITVKRCGILVYEKRSVYEYFNPEISRYEWDTTTEAWLTLDSVFTNDNTDDDSPALAYMAERWTLVEVDETWHYWLRGGFEGPTQDLLPNIPNNLDVGYGLRAPLGWDGTTGGTGYIPTDGGDHSYEPGIEGCKIGTQHDSWRYYAPRQYVRTRSLAAYPLPIWEETQPADGWDVLGSKESVVGGIETLRLHSREITQYGTDGRGFLTDEVVHNFGWFARSGSEFLYGDDTERAESAESFRYLGTEHTRYIGVGEQSHDEIVTETDLDLRSITSEVTSGLDSYLPAIERIPDSGSTTDTDVYVDDSELTDLYRKAYRTESKPISVTVTDLDLEDCSTRGVSKVQNAYIENEDEADWLARWLIEESVAAKFSGELAGANFFIEPGQWCGTVRYRQLGVNGTGRVNSVTWEWSPGNPLNTQVEILLYRANV